MVLFILFLLLGILGVRWIVLRRKVQHLEEQIGQLTVRVFRLEQERPSYRAITKEDHAVAQEQAPEPAKVANVPEPVQRPETKPVFVPQPVTPRTQAHRPSLGERIRKYLGDEEWEALVGGSLLNKIGALLLVIGIALFLGYSFTHMTPPGRALISLAVSVSLLVGGVFLERKQRYRTFARGFIGAGWAALYMTAYAIYALPAARLTDNPYLGSVLLLLVAAGMIAHSLRYRVQAITAVAFFAAFAALAVTPSSSFALLGLLPLAASLLYLAFRLDWNEMALFGVVATYATCIWRGSSGASLSATESLLFAYWLLFELFDVLRVRRDAVGSGLEFVFPLNASAFLGLSYNTWSAQDPRDMWRACAYAAALYLASAVIRAVIRPPASFPLNTDLASRMKAGGYEAPVVIAAALAALAIAGRVVGVWISAGFAIEAEIFYLAGVFLGLPFLRRLGSIGFFFSLARLLTIDTVRDATIAVSATRTIHAWTPGALFHAVLFYINRLLRKPNTLYSSVAAALIAGVLVQELPERFVPTGWMIFAAILFEIGLRRMLTEFRFQAYAVAVGGIVVAIGLNLSRTWSHPPIPLICALVLIYAMVLRVRLAPVVLPNTEWKWFDVAAGAAITDLAIIFTLQTVWILLPSPLVAPAWSAIAVALFVWGLRRDLVHERWLAYLVMIASVLNAWDTDFHAASATVVFACYLAQWLSPAEGQHLPQGWLGYVEKYPRAFWSVLGTISLAGLLRQQFPGGLVTTAWGIEGITLLAAGFPLRERVLRLEGLAMLLVCILKLFLYDLRNLEILYRILSFVALGLILLGVSWIYTRFRERVSRYL